METVRTAAFETVRTFKNARMAWVSSRGHLAYHRGATLWHGWVRSTTINSIWPTERMTEQAREPKKEEAKSGFVWRLYGTMLLIRLFGTSFWTKHEIHLLFLFTYQYLEIICFLHLPHLSTQLEKTEGCSFNGVNQTSVRSYPTRMVYVYAA